MFDVVSSSRSATFAAKHLHRQFPGQRPSCLSDLTTDRTSKISCFKRSLAPHTVSDS